MNTSDQAYILHIRAYRESSQLLNLFSRAHGRFTAVARGRTKKTAARQPFTSLQVTWAGKSELKTLVSAEPLSTFSLQGSHLYVGFYLNELLMRLVHEQDPHQDIFDHYGLLLESLGAKSDIEPRLRQFEFHLLHALGYGFSLEYDALDGDPMQAEGRYVFLPDQGFRPAMAGDQWIFEGAHLLEIAQGNFEAPEVKLAAKRLMRMALAPHLGGKPLHSRELFRGSHHVGGSDGQ